jgi:hypothetical protein
MGVSTFYGYGNARRRWFKSQEPKLEMTLTTLRYYEHLLKGVSPSCTDYTTFSSREQWMVGDLAKGGLV